MPRFELHSSRVLMLLGFAGTLAACAAPQGTRPIDHVVPAWYSGMPVMMRSFEIAPQPIVEEAQIPETSYRQVVAYIVGVVDPSIGASPAQRIPLSPQRSVTMPGHQGVVPCLAEAAAPIFGIAYAVVPGPNADRFNLKTDALPEGSIIGAPLATHVRIGPTWVPLTDHEVIAYGLHKGVLRLRFFGANPVSWATPNWDDNYAAMPEMVRACDQPRRAERTFMSEIATPLPVH